MTDTTEAPDLLNASDDDLRAMGLPPAFTLDELKAVLSDEEIAKLNEDGDVMVALPEAGATDPDEDPDEGEGDEGDDDADEGKGEDADGDADGDAEDAGDTQADADAPADPPPPAPTDTSAQRAIIDGYDEAMDKLHERYGDGDLTDSEFKAEVRALSSSVTAAEREVAEAEAKDAKAQQEYVGAWYDRVGAFLDRNPEFKSQEPIEGLPGENMLGMLDTVLKHVTGSPDFAHLSFDQKIDAGRQMVVNYVKQKTGRDIGAAKKASPASNPKPSAEDAAKAAREKAAKQGKRPSAIQTLAGVPAATEMETEDGRFAAVDRAGSGLDAEAALARMSQAEQDAYLRGAR